jgi:hypothetical protein
MRFCRTLYFTLGIICESFLSVWRLVIGFTICKVEKPTFSIDDLQIINCWKVQSHINKHRIYIIWVVVFVAVLVCMNYLVYPNRF